MSTMATVRDVDRVAEFYKRWCSDVFAFCRLFLGDALEAEAICAAAFLAFYREDPALNIRGEIPPRLVGLAVQQMQPCRAVAALSLERDALESCILSLECDPRAVFIMRNVLRMSWQGVADAMNFPLERVCRLWLEGMLKVRDSLPRDFFTR